MAVLAPMVFGATSPKALFWHPDMCAGQPMVGVAGGTFQCVSTNNGDHVSTAEQGATGNGTTNDTAALQAAINAVPATGGTLVIPKGTYILTATLVFNEKHNLIVDGYAGARNDTTEGVVFKWNGANNGTGIRVNRNQGSQFSNFNVIPGTGTLAVGIDIDQRSGGNGISTGNIFRNVVVGASTTGIWLSQTATANNEFMTFDNVIIRDAGTYGYRISQCQSKKHQIRGGSVGNRTYGIYTDGSGGSFDSYSLNFDNNVTNVSLGSACDSIAMYSSSSEGAQVFFEDRSANCNSKQVLITGARASSGNAGSNYIVHRSAGPMVLIGNDFADGSAKAGATFTKDNFSSCKGAMIVDGNTFPNATPFVEIQGRIIGRGNSYWDVTLGAQPLADRP